MKIYLKLFLVVAVIAATAFGFASCGDDGAADPLKGTWDPIGPDADDYYTLSFDNGTMFWVYDKDGSTIQERKGTYTTEDDEITFFVTHVHAAYYWLFMRFEYWVYDVHLFYSEIKEITQAEQQTAIIKALEPKLYSKDELAALGIAEFILEYPFEEFKPMKYFVEGSTLILYWEKGSITYSKR